MTLDRATARRALLAVQERATLAGLAGLAEADLQRLAFGLAQRKLIRLRRGHATLTPAGLAYLAHTARP